MDADVDDDRDSDRSQPVDFTPTRVGRTRRGPDPLLIGALLVLVGVGAAVVKPWGAGDDASIAPAPSDPAVIAAIESPAPEPAPTPPSDIGDAEAVLAVLTAARTHDAWGVQVMGDGASWTPLTPGSPAGVTVESDAPVRLLAVTHPTGDTPLDVRVWRQAGSTWRWLDVRSPRQDLGQTDLVLLPPRLAGLPTPAWAPGRYRIDLLMGAAIERIEFRLEAPRSREWWAFAGPRPSPGLTQPSGTTPAGAVALAGRRTPGAYVVAAGAVHALDAAPTDQLDEAQAWLDLRGVTDAVALPSTTAIGVTLPADASGATGSLRRLAPGPLVVPAVERLGMRPDDRGTRRPFVEFVVGGSGVWTAGTYALDVRWREDGAQRGGTWHVHLLPGSRPPESALLAAARRYAPYAIDEGVVVGRPRRLGMEAGATAVATFPMGRYTRCETARIEEPLGVVGLVLADDTAERLVRVWRPGPGGVAVPVQVRVVPSAAPGLTLVTPRFGNHFGTGVYRFAVETESSPDAARSALVCLGPPGPRTRP